MYVHVVFICTLAIAIYTQTLVCIYTCVNVYLCVMFIDVLIIIYYVSVFYINFSDIHVARK